MSEEKLIDTPALRRLRERLAAVTAAKDDAKAALTNEDRAEIALRAQIAEQDDERRAEQNAKRDVDIARRLDALTESLGAGVKLRPVVLKEYPDQSFIVRHVGAAYARFEKEIQAQATGKKIEIADSRRLYVAVCVVDWNGVTDFSAVSPDGNGENEGQRLIAFLKAHQGAVTLLANECSELAGLAKEDRKS